MSASPLRTKTTSLLAAAALAGAGGGAAVATSLSGSAPAPTARTTTVVQQAQAVASTASAASIYRAAAPSVVAITAAGTGSATGFVVDASGLIATNAHVVDGATSISVTLADGRKRTAELVGKDDSATPSASTARSRRASSPP